MAGQSGVRINVCAVYVGQCNARGRSEQWASLSFFFLLLFLLVVCDPHLPCCLLYTARCACAAASLKLHRDKVSAGDSIGEIETDKATMTFDSSDDGVIAKFLVEPGASGIPVGQVCAQPACCSRCASFAHPRNFAALCRMLASRPCGVPLTRGSAHLGDVRGW